MGRFPAGVPKAPCGLPPSFMGPVQPPGGTTRHPILGSEWVEGPGWRQWRIWWLRTEGWGRDLAHLQHTACGFQSQELTFKLSGRLNGKACCGSLASRT